MQLPKTVTSIDISGLRPCNRTVAEDRRDLSNDVLCMEVDWGTGGWKFQVVLLLLVSKTRDNAAWDLVTTPIVFVCFNQAWEVLKVRLLVSSWSSSDIDWSSTADRVFLEVTIVEHYENYWCATVAAVTLSRVQKKYSKNISKTVKTFF